MKKIMFDDHYGLTQTVLEGRKTMTRRLVPQKHLDVYEEMCRLGKPVLTLNDWLIQRKSKYKIGEEVAVAQSYGDICRNMKSDDYVSPKFNSYLAHGPHLEGEYGYSNKMYVRADLMPHRIRITDVKVEWLQDISDEDCLKEGIEKRGFEESLTRPKYVCGYEDSEQFYGFNTPKEAFASLINRISKKIDGKTIWDYNPYVFVYSFELVK